LIILKFLNIIKNFNSTILADLHLKITLQYQIYHSIWTLDSSLICFPPFLIIPLPSNWWSGTSRNYYWLFSFPASFPLILCIIINVSTLLFGCATFFLSCCYLPRPDGQILT
jgi:hypothetical protein